MLVRVSCDRDVRDKRTIMAALCSMQGTFRIAAHDGQSSWIRLAAPGRVIWPFFTRKTTTTILGSCFIVVRLTRCAVWIHWASLRRPSASQVTHLGNARPAALSFLIDVRMQRISPSVLCNVVVLWADGNKIGDSTTQRRLHT